VRSCAIEPSARLNDTPRVLILINAAMKPVKAVVRPTELGVSEEKLWCEFRSSYPMRTHPYFSLTYMRAVCRADEIGKPPLYVEPTV
jgi:hypothetical protein